MILIDQKYYFYLTTAVATMLSAGLAALLWFYSKRAKGVLLHTLLQVNLTTVALSLLKPERRRNLKFSHYLILILCGLVVLLSRMDTLINSLTQTYAAYPSQDSIRNTLYTSMGPLTYLDSNAQPDKTNTPTVGAIAAVLKGSNLLYARSTYETLTGIFQLNSSCDSTSNILMNAVDAVALPGTIITSIFDVSDSQYPITSLNNYQNLIFNVYMGPTLRSIVNNTAKNGIATCYFGAYANGNGSPFAAYMIPIVGTESMGSAYLFSLGVRGAPGAYSPYQNNYLFTTLIEVTNVRKSSLTHGIIYACFKFLSIQDSTNYLKCIVSVRTYPDLQAYTMVVLSFTTPMTLNRMTIETEMDVYYFSQYQLCPITLDYTHNIATVNDGSNLNTFGFFAYDVFFSSRVFKSYSSTPASNSSLFPQVFGMEPLKSTCDPDGGRYGIFQSLYSPGTNLVSLDYAALAVLVSLAALGFLISLANDYMDFLQDLLLAAMTQGAYVAPEQCILLPTWLGLSNVNGTSVIRTCVGDPQEMKGVKLITRYKSAKKNPNAVIPSSKA